MKSKRFRLFNIKGAALAMCGILSMFGIVGSASADCVVDKTTSDGFDPDPSVFTLLIDATSSCSNLSDNMYGCVTDAMGNCTITNTVTGETIEVTLDEGSVGGTTPIRWSTSEGDSLVDFVITVGANNGGSCGTSYSPGSDFGKGLGFLKNNGSTQKVNSVSFCSDFFDPETEPVAETCPENFQRAVNQLSQETGLDFAFLQDPNQSGTDVVCVPNGEDGSANTIRVACNAECITKPICEIDPTNEACTPSVCEPSGVWTTFTTSNGTTTCTEPVNTPPEVDPYCWEIQQDLNKDCTLNEWEPQEKNTLLIEKGHVNPYVYQSCYSSGGRYVCETMCFSFSPTDALLCPPGSTVF